MRTIEDALQNGTGGLYYGNRVFLPFVVDILKLVVEREIIMDFRSSARGAEYKQFDDFTELYFTEYSDLENTVSKYETIKIIVVEKGKDIFDEKNHTKLILHFKEHHKVELEIPDENILFIN